MAMPRSWKALLSSWKRRRASAEGLGRHPKPRTLRVEPLEQREMLTVSAPDGIGLYNPTTSYFDLRHTNSAGSADLSVGYGTANDGWKAVIGDWNADAIDTVGAYDPTSASFFYLRNTNTTGSADNSFGFGVADAGWLPIAGDWDGVGGYDTIGLYDPASATFYLRNSNSTGGADVTFGFGGANWQPVAGDWNGDGVDSIGVYVDGTFYLRNANSTGDPNYYVSITNAPTTNVKAIAGDWNGDGIYSVGLYCTTTATFYLKNTSSSGAADYVFTFGNTNETRTPVAGHWANWYPTAVADSYSTNEDTTLTVAASSGVLANDVDPEGETKTAELVSGVSAAQGTLTFNSNGSFTFVPAANYYGTATFTYRTSPGAVEVNSRTATVSITVNSVNDAPTLTSISTIAGPNEDTAFTLSYATLAAAANEADVDSSTLSFRVEAVSSGTLTKGGAAVTAGTTLLSTGEQWVWTPASNANGTLAAFTVKAYDGSLASSTAIQVNVNVNAVNDAPTLTSVSTLTSATEDTAFTIPYATLAAAANEADVDSSTLSFRVEAVSSGTLTKGGTAVTAGTTRLSTGEQWAWTPAVNANGTQAAFTVKAYDGSLTSSTAIQVNVNVNAVNDAPTLTSISTIAGASEDTAFALSYATLTAAANEADVDSSALSFRVEAVSNGTLTKGGTAVTAGTTLLSIGEQWVWTPAVNANGTLAAFTVKAYDGALASSTAIQVNVSVAAVNDAPVLDNSGALGMAVINQNDTASSGTTIAAILASDGGNPITDVDTDAVEGIAVTGVDNTHGTWQYSTDGGTNWSAFGTPSTTAARLLAADANTRVRFVPATDWYGTVAAGITFRAWDRTSGSNGGTADASANGSPTAFSTASETASIAVNALPTLTTVDTLTGVQEDTAFAITYQMLAAAADEADLDSSSISFRAESVLNGTLTKNGTAVTAGTTLLSSGEQWLWTPAANANGTLDGFSVKAWDGVGASTTALTVSLTVAAINDAPVRTAGSVSSLAVLEDAAMTTLGLSDVAYGPGGGADEAGQSLTYCVTAVPSATLGQVLLADGATIVTTGSYTLAEIRGMQFLPAANANGSGTFSFSIQDDGGTANSGVDTRTETIAITVTAVNDVPSFTAGASQMINEDAGAQTVTGWATGMSVGPANESAQTLNFIVTTDTVSQSLFATLPAIDPATGTLTYTPAANAYGVAHVNVALHDNGGTANTGVDTSPNQSFLIVISAVNDLPTISTIANQTVNEDFSTGALSFTIGDVEMAAADLVITAVSSNPAVVSSANVVVGTTEASRSVTVTPTAHAYGTTTITLTVTDGLGASASTSFTVTVNSINDLPVISPIANTATDKNTTTPALSFTVSDVETAVGSLTLNRSSSNTAVVPLDNIVIDGNGSARTVTITPASNVAGTVTITLTAADAQNGVGQMTFTLTVGSKPAGVGLYNAVDSYFYFRNSTTAGSADCTVPYGTANDGWQPVLGDWNNDQLDTMGLYDPTLASYFWMRNENRSGDSTLSMAFGVENIGWLPVSGDWSWPEVTQDGETYPAVSADGYDTVGLYDQDNCLFMLRNSNTTGEAERTFAFGVTGYDWLPVAGDWDGDGDDTVGLFDPVNRTFYLAPENTAGAVALTFTVSGVTGSDLKPVVGDWDGDGIDTVAIYANSTGTFYLKNANTGGAADRTFVFQPSTSATYYPVGGYWNDPPTISTIADQQTAEDTPITDLAFTISDGQSTADQLTVSVSSSDTTLFPAANLVLSGSGAARTLTLTPALNQSGTATITLTLTDDQGGTSTENFSVTVQQQDEAPTISDIEEGVITTRNLSTLPMHFTVGDDETPAYGLTVEAIYSSNPDLVPLTNVTLGGSEADRTITITPTADRIGAVEITLKVSDADGWYTTTTVLAEVNSATSTVGLYDPSTAVFYLRNDNAGGMAQQMVAFGTTPNWLPVTGDWNADTIDTLGVYDPTTSTFYLNDAIDSSNAEYSFGFGAPGAGWLPIAGDWNGDGNDTVGLYDPIASVFYLRDRNDSNVAYADYVFGFGAPNAGWLPIAGDWDGDGCDSIGLYDPASSTFYLKDQLAAGFADHTVPHGAPGAGWKPVAGDWNANGTDSIGVYEPSASQFYLLNEDGTKVMFGYGAAGSGWKPIFGNWDGTDSPSFTLNGGSVDENCDLGTEVGTFATLDNTSEAEGVSFSLVDGIGSDDNACFTIEQDTEGGYVLKTNADVNYESCSTYRIRVLAESTDPDVHPSEQVFTITVNNVNEAPTTLALSNATVAENRTTATTVGTLSNNDPDANNTFTYSLVTGSGAIDNESFQIVGSTLRTRDSARFDYESRPTCSVRIRCQDQGGLSTEQIFTITVTNVNEVPYIAQVSDRTIGEDTPVTLNLALSDPDTPVTSLTLTGSSSNGALVVFGGSGAYRTVTITPPSNASGPANITVTANDHQGGTYPMTFGITVDGVNDAPTNITLSETHINEGLPAGTLVGTLSADDPDLNDTRTYKLVSGGDYFAIDGNKLVTAVNLDHETHSSHSITVAAVDAAGYACERTFSIVVNDVAGCVASVGTATVIEGDQAVVQVTLADPPSSTSEPVKVAFTTSNGTAYSGTDYSPPPEIVMFETGQATMTCTIPTYSTSSGPSSKTFHTTIAIASGSGEASVNTAFSSSDITILDENEVPITLAIDNVRVNEPATDGTGTATFTIQIVSGKPHSSPSGALSVHYATQDGSASYIGGTDNGDYGQSGGDVSLYRGAPVTIDVPIYPDNSIENDESFELVISWYDSVFHSVTGRCTITGSNGPTYLSCEPVTVAEGDIAEFVVKVAGPENFTGWVDFSTVSGTATAWTPSTPNGDYLPTSGSLYFDSSQTEQKVYVSTLPDSAPESTEYFNLHLSMQRTSGGSIDIYPRADILDDDQTPTIDLDATTVAHNVRSGLLNDSEELSSGAYVPLNEDDDDYDASNLPDSSQKGAISGENDLLAIVLHPIEPVTIGGHYRLQIPNNVFVWTFADRTVQVVAGSEFDATEETTLYVEGRFEGAGTIAVDWYNDTISVVGADSILVNVFRLYGPLNVPNYSKYDYRATGGASADSFWTTPSGGSLVSSSSSSTTDTAEILWGSGPVVGKASYQAATGYVWDLDVNVVQIVLTSSEDAFARGTDPTDGTHVDWFRGFEAKIVNSGDPAIYWAIEVTLYGPNGDRGLRQMRIGFVQNVDVARYWASYRTVSKTLTSSLEGQSFLDCDEESGGPYYTTDANAVIFGATPTTSSRTLFEDDGPSGGPPLTFDKGIGVDYTDDVVDELELIWNFHLYLTASTSESRNNASSVYTALASADWTFNGSGEISQTSPYKWTRSGTVVTFPTAWSMLTHGERPTLVGGAIFNTELKRDSWN
jgi:hypothetical protein